MNKFFIFLAFVSFALLACSDEPAPSHSELCAKNPITKECLKGRWSLERIENDNGDCPRYNVSDLTFKANGEFIWEDDKYDRSGYWKLNDKGTEIDIECISGDCVDGFEKIKANISIKSGDLIVTATSDGLTSFSQCKITSSAKLTEVFGWQGAK